RCYRDWSSDVCSSDLQGLFARTRGCDPMKGILEKAKFGADGLIPAIIQDARTREVLTVAYMNREALQLTLERGETYFWSRSRQRSEERRVGKGCIARM